MIAYDTDRWAARRRPFDLLEQRAVKLFLASHDDDARPVLEALRYVLSFARLTAVRNAAGVDVDVSGVLHLHAQQVRDLLGPELERADSIWSVVRALPDVVHRTRRARASLLEHLPIDRDSLEAEVTTRLLAVASGGGGGAGYVYPGCYEMLERHGLVPDLMTGTSIGALMSMFRARRRRYDFARFVSAARSLSWSSVFRVFESQSRYGIPATLNLDLRQSLGHLFEVEGEDRFTRMSELEIPLYIVTTGISDDSLKHDLGYYQHLLANDVSRTGVRNGVRMGLAVINVLREFLSQTDALSTVVLGRAAGTEGIDVLDAAGFSAAIPGVIHYDVLRNDPWAAQILDDLYANYGITRLGEGGIMSNVPARIAWETAVSGRFGRRNVFVIALDCFAPNPRKLAWYPFQQLVRSANVDRDRKFADFYLDFDETLSPMNLVPPLRDALMAMRWGRDRIRPHMPFIVEMMRPVEVLRDQSNSGLTESASPVR